MKTLAEILKFARSEDLPAPVIPGVHEIALAFATALLGSPKFADGNHVGAVATAWSLVPHFYQGEAIYREMMLDMMQRQAMMEAALREAETDPPEMSVAEQRAYVGGESDSDHYQELGQATPH